MNTLKERGYIKGFSCSKGKNPTVKKQTKGSKNKQKQQHSPERLIEIHLWIRGFLVKRQGKKLIVVGVFFISS